MRPLNEIIVHCTATRADWWKSRSTSQKVKEIRRWHVEDRGWRDIGYHYLIDRDGTIAKGRPLEQTGAHVAGHNTGTIGISLFGGHGGTENDAFLDNFTPEQERALRTLISDLQNKYGITKVTGHNQYAAKACPTFNVPRWMAGKTPARQSLLSSSTVRTAIAGSGLTAAGVAETATGLDDKTQLALVALIGVAMLLVFGYIIMERRAKWLKGVR